MARVISSILIANRGEIALRVIRASKELGIRAIAVYSDEDTRSVHVKRADEAYHIGPAAAVESYLNTQKIIETATMAGADAIHPGYGFLSEDENFAEMCEKKGIVFIGPSSKAMALTGDKMKCKALMSKSNVPVIPGSEGNIDDVDKA
jgi:acetyl-CoA/propionyl-CoA carboxylase